MSVRTHLVLLMKRVKVLGWIALAGVIGYRIHELGLRAVERGLIDHPMMTLYPKFGNWLYARPDDHVSGAVAKLKEIAKEIDTL